MAGRAKKVDLTDKYLRALKRQQHPGKPRLIFIYDGTCPGLNVLWTPTALSWGMTKRWPQGKPNPSWRSLGTVYLPPKNEKKPEPDDSAPAEPITNGALTLAEARVKARRWIDMLERGIDPATKARQQRIEAQKRVTFDQLREAYLKAFAGKAKHGEAIRILNREFTAWEGRFAADIDAGDVEAAIQVIVDRGKLAQARNAFGYVRSMYGWAKGRPLMRIKKNPCDEIKIVGLAGAKKSDDRWFRDEEVRTMWGTTDHLGIAGSVLKLLFLTGKRENEIAYMRWSEIDFDNNQIIIPGTRPPRWTGMKSHREHLQPLSPMMREILMHIPRGKAGDFVFSTTGGRLPITFGSKIKAKVIELGMPAEPHWKWHDVRRTARTNWSKLGGIAQEVREAMLDHVKQGLIKTYDIHDYADEKRNAYMLWEMQLRKILNPAPSTVEDIGVARARRAS